MRVISLFAGAGGLDLGFMLAGHEIVWANDFDPDALNTYHHNLNKIQDHQLVLGDITKVLNIPKDEIDKLVPDGDIVIGGFPCQGFSIANLNRNMSDSRNHLYLEILKIIDAKKPKYILLENVKGLENMEKGEILKMIISDLEKSGPGYDVVYNVFNVCDFGVPQNRERVIIVGIRKDLDNSIFEIPEKKDTVKDFKKLIIPNTHSKNESTNPEYSSVEVSNLAFNHLINKDYEKINELMTSEKSYRHLNLKDTIADLPHNFCEDNDFISNHSGTKCIVKINGRVGNRATEWGKISPTIMGRGSGTGGPLIIPHPNLHRRMSVREVARIQSFPDKFLFTGSNTAKYRQIGNAVPPLFAYHLGRLFS